MFTRTERYYTNNPDVREQGAGFTGQLDFSGTSTELVITVNTITASAITGHEEIQKSS